MNISFAKIPFGQLGLIFPNNTLRCILLTCLEKIFLVVYYKLTTRSNELSFTFKLNTIQVTRGINDFDEIFIKQNLTRAIN